MALISDLKVALISGDGTSREQIAAARETFEQSGIEVLIVSFDDEIETFDSTYGNRIKVDLPIHEAQPTDFDGVLVPDLIDPLVISGNPHVTTFISRIYQMGKPVGAVGRAVFVLQAAEVVHDHMVSVSKDIRRLMEPSSGFLSDKPLTVDRNLLSCTGDPHLNDFIALYLEALQSQVRSAPMTSL